jgi:hypothetical protein
LEKRENRDDIDFLQMNGYVPCGIISIVFNLKKNRMALRHTPFFLSAMPLLIKKNMAPCIADVPFISSKDP